jgi:hypothetical protein
VGGLEVVWGGGEAEADVLADSALLALIVDEDVLAGVHEDTSMCGTNKIHR